MKERAVCCSFKASMRILAGMRLLPAPAALLLTCLLVFPLTAQGRGGNATAGCADPLAVLIAFYDATDAGRYGAFGMRYLAEGAVIQTWATGVNGYIMAKRRMEGKAQIRKALRDARGLARHLPDSPPDGPIYHADRITVTGTTVRLMLEPDRKRPNGRIYNPFSVEAVLDGCLITSLTVIEQVTWL
jgi:hypothetical protein